jgi:diacylglycerol kinase family enzyme
LRIPDMDTAIAAIARNQPMRIDLGLLTYTDNNSRQTHRRLFQNITSAGLGGLVDRYVKDLPRLPGKLAYAAASFRALVVYKNAMMFITIDDSFEAEMPTAILAVGNGRFFGAGMKACPDAQLDDGLFDITIFGNLTKWELATLSRTIYDGAHIYDPKVITRRGKVVTANSEVDVFLDVDGEPLGRLPATFQIVPQVLEVLSPQ